MGKPRPFTITLSCDDYSLAPGAAWSAFVGFRPTRDGFSVWATGSTNYDDNRYNKRIAHLKGQEITWRSACRALLDANEGGIFGDFRDQVRVDGVDGWKADIIAVCWMQEDEISRNVKEFLVGLSDEDIEWLIDRLDDDLISDRSIELLERFVEVEERSPRACWDELSESENMTFESLIERTEQAKQDKHEKRLAPFKKDIEKIIESVTADWPKPSSWITNIGAAQKKQRLRNAIHAIVENHRRLPTSEEIQRFKSLK